MSWDRFVKVFHWSLATGIVANYIFLEGGDQPHEWLGYALCVLVITRLFWGFRGPSNARFISFMTRPSAVWKGVLLLRTPHELPRTHTAAGGYQLVLMMLLIMGLGVTGWIHDLDAFWGDDWPEDAHDIMANALITLSALHVTVVLWMQFVLNMPVIRRMWIFKS